MGFDPYQVTATEQGVVRLFTTDLEPEGDMAITAQNVNQIINNTFFVIKLLMNV